ncbi:Thymidine phosphorylase, partial [Frankliniella fusca]
MFINVYRLLMTYSLIKPPRGSNVTGGQVMDTMLQLKDIKGEDDKIRKLELQERIDELLDSEIEIPEELELGTHEGLTASVDSYALTAFGGYVARKVRQIKPVSECTECQRMLLQEDEFLERESLLAIRTRGGLLRPSQKLFELLVKLEEAVMTVASGCGVHGTLIFTVLDELLSSHGGLDLVGCDLHQRGLTTSIITFYLNTRMHFVCAESDRAVADSR